MFRMRPGLTFTPKKLVFLMCLLIIVYILLPEIVLFCKYIMHNHHNKYDELQLQQDFSACATKTFYGGVVSWNTYHGYTRPCDVYGIDKSAYAAALAKRASPDKKILLIMIDRGSLDFTLNFYESSLKVQKVYNYLFLSVDNTACNELIKRNIACHMYKEDRDASHDSIYYSEDFLRKMNYRTFMILDALELGYSVLHSDVDMHFFRNPFTEISCKVSTCDMAILRDYNYHDQSGSYNAGFIFMHATKAAIEVYKRMAWMAFHVRLDDQIQLNNAIEMVQGDDVFGKYYKGQERNKLKVFYLKKESFLSGSIFWKDGEVSFAGDKTWPHPVVAHNNWMVSLIAKEYRFKEMLMWMYDKDQYFSNPDAKYLIYNNTVVFNTEEETQKQEILALKNALAVAHILNRILILPYFHCNQKRKCNFLNHLSLRSLYKEFPNFREHMFLLHPKVPLSVKESFSKLNFISSASENNKLSQKRLNKHTVIHKSKSDDGATSDEILNWYRDDKSSILRFDSLYGVFYKFNDATEDKDFKRKVPRAFQFVDYVQRENTLRNVEFV